MKRNLLLLVLLTIFNLVYTQKYDLIVTTAGDSIACRIDSLTEIHVYFEMKIRNYWVHTQMDNSKISKIKKGVLDKKTVHFKPGTSYIVTKEEQAVPMYKYSLILVIMDFGASSTLSYERLIAINDKSRIAPRGGLGWNFWYMKPVATGEFSMLIGRSKHFFETGIGISHLIAHHPQSTFIPVMAGYRYIDPKGFVFKALPAFVIHPDLSIEYGGINPWFRLFFGYRFKI